MSSTHTVSASELLAISAAGQRCELVRGELRELAWRGFGHGQLAMQIAGRLFHYVEQTQLGLVCAAGTGFLIEQNPDTVRAPAVAIVVAERAEKLARLEGYFPGAPDLAVEVISPSDQYSEVEEKVEQWLTAGCRMLIVVNPRSKSAVVYRPDGSLKRLSVGDAMDGADVVPGWQLPLGEIFV